MNSLLKRAVGHLIRRGQTGQAIVILALGFIGLVGFVGITTDVSLMFVRYSTLRRAVDAAAIAAAGQIREDRNLGDVGMAARQFIEFHNLNPRRVLVDTCETVRFIDVDPDEDGIQPDPDLCTPDRQKLVRVTAEIDSPTVFLRLLLPDEWATFELRASAISQTAALDIVMILDASESMANETTYESWAEIGLGKVYMPPISYADADFGTPTDYTIYGRQLSAGVYPPDRVADGLAFFFNFWQDELLNVPQELVNQRLDYGDVGLNTDPGETVGVNFIQPDFANDAYTVEHEDFPGYGPQGHPRAACRVRFWPYSQRYPVPTDLLQLYSNLGLNWRGGSSWDGFVPTYNFYGCCNDPGTGTIDAEGEITMTGINADQSFDDLICQPMKDARDATRRFLERVDFERGDRVALVTFDRTAFTIQPNNPDGTSNPMMYSRATAIQTMNETIGVRAEPNAYVWDEDAHLWMEYAQGLDADGQSVFIDYYSTANVALRTYSDPDVTESTNPQRYNDYPVYGNCPFMNAALDFPFSRYATVGDDGWPINTRNAALYNIATPFEVRTPELGYETGNTYELWASCRNANIGAALREANSVLVNEGRGEGSIRIIILLSDGAAGGSDPVRRNRIIPVGANPYEPVSQTFNRNTFVTPDTSPEDWGVNRFGTPGDYGAFGLCPWGTGAEPGELLLTDNEPTILFPYCSDESPTTRHFCRLRPDDVAIAGEDIEYGVSFEPGRLDVEYNLALPVEGQETHIYDVDVGNYPDAASMGICSPLYDVDDYARDWADYLVRLPSNGVGETDASLPTIFTIGFGINFDAGDGSCAANVPDCLGEELLRYIADVGDNYQIDNDYQQDWRDDMQLNHSVRATTRGYGSPDICENPAGLYPTLENPTPELVLSTLLTPGQSCGNYYNAPSAAELDIVFDEIASRMLTRLAG
jgi:hypothetical protein